LKPGGGRRGVAADPLLPGCQCRGNQDSIIALARPARGPVPVRGPVPIPSPALCNLNLKISASRRRRLRVTPNPSCVRTLQALSAAPRLRDLVPPPAGAARGPGPGVAVTAHRPPGGGHDGGGWVPPLPCWRSPSRLCSDMLSREPLLKKVLFIIVHLFVLMESKSQIL
jgi:hypothetical protein